MLVKRFSVWFSVFLLVVVAQPASAADVTASAEVGSAYVWRGLTYNDGMVLQPSVDITNGAFGLNVWGNLDIEDYDDQYDSGEFSEVDVTASYLFEVRTMDFTVGYTEYLFPTTDRSGRDGTREIFGKMAMPLGFGISLDLGLYYDIDKINDLYLDLGFGYTYVFSKQLSIGTGVSIAYAGDEYCYDGSAGLYDYNFSLSGMFALDEDLSVTAFMKYTNSMDEDNLKDMGRAGSLDVNFYCGVGIAYSF